MKSQCQRILEYMEKGNSISTMTAMRRFNIADPRARIRDLKDAGYPIESRWIKRRSKITGKTVRYCLHRLEGS